MTSTKSCVVLVTGGSGFLGQHVVGLLQTRVPHVTEIRVLDLPSNPYANKLDYIATKPVKQYLGSINDAKLVREACEGVHCVMHIAGLIDVSMFPDMRRLEEINVEETRLLLHTCQELGVERFLYCSTMDVVCGDTDIIDGTESTTSKPKSFFFGGYASTKSKAEDLVLNANSKTFHTLSIRPTTMYGEEDRFTVYEPLETANKFGRWTRFDCKDAVHQMTYAGNVAWMFVCAETTMFKDKNKQTHIGANAYFATDDTPLTNIFDFLDPFARACGFSTKTFKIPAWIVLYCMFLVYALMWCLRFIIKINLRLGLVSFRYMTRTFTFRSDKAKRDFGYSPLYSYNESLERSIRFYKMAFPR